MNLEKLPMIFDFIQIKKGGYLQLRFYPPIPEFMVTLKFRDFSNQKEIIQNFQ